MRVLALFGGAVLFGQERGNIEALRALREEGCEILCLVRNEEWGAPVRAVLDSYHLKWRAVPYIELPQAGRWKYVIFRNPLAFVCANVQFLRILRQFRPTHIHAFNQVFVLNFLVGLIISRSPLVYRAGDEPTAHNWLWRAIWYFITKRTSKFVAISKYIAGALTRQGVDEKRIVVIYNRPPRRSSGSGVVPDLKISSNDFAVAFVGQLTPSKGPQLLIEAAKALLPQYPELRLFIVGRITEWSGDAWARSLREDTLSDSLLRERVTFTGYIDNSPAVMAQCRLVIVPSQWAEPLGNVVMEAKIVGRPSIVFPCGGLPEMIEHGVDGSICNSATSASLADSLEVYLRKPGLAALQGEAARSSLQRLGVQVFSQRWLQVYRDSKVLPVPHKR